MKARRILVAVLALIASGCLKTIETVAWPSMADAKEMSQRELDAIAELEADMTRQHSVGRTPEEVAAIESSAASFDAQMSALKEAADNQTGSLVTMLVMALGAAGAGGVIGKTGKSRGHVDIEKIKDRLDSITTDIALAKPSSVAAELVAHGTAVRP